MPHPSQHNVSFADDFRRKSKRQGIVGRIWWLVICISIRLNKWIYSFCKTDCTTVQKKTVVTLCAGSGSSPMRMRLALLLSFSHACARIVSAIADVRWGGVGRNYRYTDTVSRLLSFNPLTPIVAIWHSVGIPDRVKPSFVIFDIRALWHSALSVRVPGCQKLQMTA